MIPAPSPKPYEQQTDEEKRISYQTALLDRNEARQSLERAATDVHAAELDRDRALAERDELQRKLDERTQPESNTLPTPEEITRRILDGTLDPAQAKVALYALQVSLTAKRTEHLIAAQRQKEERLRSPKLRTRTKKTRPRKRRP